MPYGVRGLRVVVSVLCLAAIDAVVFVAVDGHAANGTLIALLAPQLPIAYLVAWYGVARARRGDTPTAVRAASMRELRRLGDCWRNAALIATISSSSLGEVRRASG